MSPSIRIIIGGVTTPNTTRPFRPDPLSKEMYVSDEGQTNFDGTMRHALSGQVSRARLLAMAGAGVAAVAVPEISRAQTSGQVEATQDILNIADTAEHLAVTLLTAAVANAGPLGLTASGGLLLAVVQAALAEEQYHADFLEANGAKPLTDTFTVPDPKILTDPITFFTTVEAAETLFIGAYMAATREFSEMNQRTLAQYAYQIGGVEAEHRVLARAALALAGQDHIPPNNKAFETDVVHYVKDAAAMLHDLGFIGGSGNQVTYPGRSAALAAAAPVLASVTDTKPS